MTTCVTSCIKYHIGNVEDIIMDVEKNEEVC